MNTPTAHEPHKNAIAKFAFTKSLTIHHLVEGLTPNEALETICELIAKAAKQKWLHEIASDNIAETTYFDYWRVGIEEVCEGKHEVMAERCLDLINSINLTTDKRSREMVKKMIPFVLYCLSRTAPKEAEEAWVKLLTLGDNIPFERNVVFKTLVVDLVRQHWMHGITFAYLSGVMGIISRRQLAKHDHQAGSQVVKILWTSLISSRSLRSSRITEWTRLLTPLIEVEEGPTGLLVTQRGQECREEMVTACIKANQKIYAFFKTSNSLEGRISDMYPQLFPHVIVDDESLIIKEIRITFMKSGTRHIEPEKQEEFSETESDAIKEQIAIWCQEYSVGEIPVTLR